MLLAVDRADVAAGQVYNCGDAEVLTLRQVVDVIAEALGHTWEVVSIPCWKRALTMLPPVDYRTEPGYTSAYSGPGSRPRKQGW